MDSQQTLVLILGFVLLAGLMIFPQIQSRRRRQKQIAALKVGEQVMTVGGIIGKLAHLDVEGDRARVEVAPGVEIEVVLAAISRALTEEG